MNPVSKNINRRIGWRCIPAESGAGYHPSVKIVHVKAVLIIVLLALVLVRGGRSGYCFETAHDKELIFEVYYNNPGLVY